jgi:NAD(P)-dependent dehydrogenase (short-subunit alcohol dehydrogenase family)
MGKVIAITGGFGTLGAAVGAAAREQGWELALIDRAPVPAGLALAKAEGVLALGGVDLADAAAAKQAMDQIVQRFGRLDALANVAGGFRWQTLADGDLANWDWLYTINVRTAATASKAALPHLLASKDGAIVNVGAAAATKSGMGMGAYAASKAGVLRLTESLAEELKDRGVRVNAVLPSIIDTPPNRTDMPDADVSRWVAPADLASVILFLASDRARAVTGALVPVMGRV